MMAMSDPELAGILRNMDGRISNLEGQGQGINARLLGLEEGQRELGRRIDRIFYALIGLGGAVIGILGGGLITLIVRGAGGDGGLTREREVGAGSGGNPPFLLEDSVQEGRVWLLWARVSW